MSASLSRGWPFVSLLGVRLFLTVICMLSLSSSSNFSQSRAFALLLADSDFDFNSYLANLRCVPSVRSLAFADNNTAALSPSP